MPSQSDREWEDGPFRLRSCGDLSLLRRSLEAADYTEAAISRILLRDAAGKPVDLAAALRRTTDASPLHTLVRLFILAQAIPEEAARAVLGSANLEGLLAMGLLRLDAEGLRAQAALMPSDDLLLAREFWPDFTGLPMAKDYVLGVGMASRMVAHSTVRRQAELALDLGTGTGFLALLAGSHARQVIATDINPRALSFAALNARLNGLSNIEFRRGSLFEPVADCRFDLLMANPPFVISPKADYEYRDSGLVGDTICEQLIRKAPEMLREGGYCTVLFNWHHQNAEDWAQRPIEWLTSSGCDAWLTCLSTTDPIGYATTWLREEDVRDPARHARLMDEWVSYLESLHIGLISLGALLLRRRSGGPNWIRAECAPAGGPTQSCSEQIQRIFAAEDLLRKTESDEDLLAKSFLLTSDHQLEQVLRAEAGHWAVQGAQLKQTRGYPFVGNVDRLVSTLLVGCDGRQPLKQLVAHLAESLSADPDQLASGCCNVIRTLLHWGFLSAV